MLRRTPMRGPSRFWIDSEGVNRSDTLIHIHWEWKPGNSPPRTHVHSHQHTPERAHTNRKVPRWRWWCWWWSVFSLFLTSKTHKSNTANAMAINTECPQGTKENDGRIKRWSATQPARNERAVKERESERARGGRRCSQSKGLPHSQSYDTLNALVARAIRVCTRINDTRFNIGRLSGTLCTLFGADGQLRRQRKHENL